jgi:Domain of unknown function (DUF3943)
VFSVQTVCLRRLRVAAALIGGCPFTAHAEAPPSAAAIIDYNLPTETHSLEQYWRAGTNVVFTNWLIWQLAWLRDKDWAPVTRSSLADNLKAGFEFDQDVLQTNFFGHPYHGGLMYSGARATGFGFWGSAAYTAAGSLTWELFAERENPSFNDLAVTVLGGIMLGEITHRLSSEALDDSAESGRLFRELGAAAVSPVRGLDRVATGAAWRKGARGARNPLRIELELGVDRVSLRREQDATTPSRPALLFAADVEYGALLPRGEGSTLSPFEFFELYAAANLLSSALSGAHVYSSALLFGFSLPLSPRESPERTSDNDVIGFGMSYEYVGTNFTTYSGVGVGAQNHLMLRVGSGRSLRLSAGADIVPVLGASSTQAGSGERDYNFAMGFSPWTGVELRIGRFGELGLQMRHYIATVVDGEKGDELIGSTRLWYEVDLLHGLGVGFAPTLVYRRGQYHHRDSYSAQQLSAQLYLTSRL